MRQKVLINEFYKQEEQLLLDNEYAVNRQSAFISFIIGGFIIPFIFLLRSLGFFLFTNEEGLIHLIISAIVLVTPSIIGLFKGYKKPWFKYVIVSAVTLCIPSMYIAFDYMMLMLWVMPILTSCLYFNKHLNIISLLFDILILGLTSYYRSAQRLADGLIGARIGGLFKDFLVSFTTYTLLLSVLFIFIYMITKKSTTLLYEMIKSKQYEKMSIMDGLTGTFNYRFVVTSLERCKLEYERDGTPFSIIVFDVDHFKRINDAYGHLIGDKALIQICETLKENIREKDILGRYGGEEFIIVFPNTSSKDAYLISELCREAISHIVVANTNIQLTVSGGIQEYKGGLISDLINKADMKMYFAKNAGRNKVEMIHSQVFQTAE